MVERIIELSVRHTWIVFGATFALALFAAEAVRKTPLDALPDLSDPQVIVYTEWMGRSPDLVEDQITYPLVRALQSTPGVQTVRGYSMFGMSFAYALFDEGTDIYWESGVGADVSARTAAPVVGGLWSCMLLTLLVLPAAYAMWRRHQVRVRVALSLSRDVGVRSMGAVFE
jgi:Cu/Ag efflux pump CusA